MSQKRDIMIRLTVSEEEKARIEAWSAENGIVEMAHALRLAAEMAISSGEKPTADQIAVTMRNKEGRANS